jgi:hypothetical protein
MFVPRPTRLLAAMLLAAVPAFASSTPTNGDTYLNSAAASTAFGAQPAILVNGTSTGLFQFAQSLPVGTIASQIAQATLTVYVNTLNSAGTFEVRRVTRTWAEGGASFSKNITYDATSYGTFSAGAAGKYFTVDVTALVQYWIANPGTNFGLALISTGGDVALDSKENTSTAHTAALQGAQGLVGPVGPSGPVGPQGPAGSSGGAAVVKDGNGTVIGTFLAVSNTGVVSFRTSTGYVINAYLDGAIPNGQFGWSVANCGDSNTTDPSYISIGSANSKRYDRFVSFSAKSNSFYAPVVQNSSTHIAITVPFTFSSFENTSSSNPGAYVCSAGGSNNGFPTEKRTVTDLGVPSATGTPLAFPAPLQLPY